MKQFNRNHGKKFKIPTNLIFFFVFELRLKDLFRFRMLNLWITNENKNRFLFLLSFRINEETLYFKFERISDSFRKIDYFNRKPDHEKLLTTSSWCGTCNLDSILFISSCLFKPSVKFLISYWGSETFSRTFKQMCVWLCLLSMILKKNFQRKQKEWRYYSASDHFSYKSKFRYSLL